MVNTGNLNNGRLTEKSYWLDTSENYTLNRHDTQNDIIQLIRKYISKNDKGTCFEIGSFPGPFLAAFGDLGYELNGIDFNPRNADEVPNWLKKEGLKVGNFYSEDFFSFKSEVKYDLICSFGFIEHFINYNDVIQMHINLCKDEGYLMITTPNFRGLMQKFLHRWLDNENLKQHHLPAMNVSEWKEQLEKAGFEIIFSGYFGGLRFWVERSHKRKKIAKFSLWIVERVAIRLNKFIKSDSENYSAYAGIIARRMKTK